VDFHVVRRGAEGGARAAFCGWGSLMEKKGEGVWSGRSTDVWSYEGGGGVPCGGRTREQWSRVTTEQCKTGEVHRGLVQGEEQGAWAAVVC
jgi:hypothetical protein